jgi:predicted PhzF superfamily epimerase YddE/YHI9
MPLPLLQVDAFSEKPFSGNPAAVCLLEGPRPEAWMRALAAEMNLSETAFLYPLRENAWSLRWFTPKVEVDLCGHATLASAHALWETGRACGDALLTFETRSGALYAHRERDGRIVLDFPAVAVTEESPPAGMLAALGIEKALFCGRNRMDWLVEAESEAALRALHPDFASLAKVEARGVIVTARPSPPPVLPFREGRGGGEKKTPLPRGEGTGEGDSGGEADFVSRFFAPRAGVDEDPVTGSAHCALAPYWGAKLGRREMTGFQASARGGVVGVRLRGGRVELAGNAVTVLRGELADAL